MPKGAERNAGLTRRKVIEAAVQLADERGLAALSMRKLADMLGVEAMSLYHHVANKEMILAGMVDHVMGEIALPVDAASWREAMFRRAAAFRDVLNRHHWSIALIDSQTQPGPATLRHHDWVIGVLLKAGFSLEMTGRAFALLDSYVYGFAVQEQALPADGGDEIREIAGDMMAEAMADFPNLQAFVAGRVMTPDYAFSNEFAFGLNLILDGLEQRLGL